MTQSNFVSEQIDHTLIRNRGADVLLVDSRGIINQNSCNAAYPDFCIPHSPPDLDCPDINANNFTVRPPDPHKLDRDHDGVGCEKQPN